MTEVPEPKCTNEQLGRKLFRLALRPTGPRHLEPELQTHLEECPSCSLNFPLWKKKGYFAGRLIEAQSIVSQAKAGDKGVQTKCVGEKTAYFRPASTNSGIGVMVVTDDAGSIVQIDDVAREVFLSAKLGE
jgi:hypothetical protein